MSLTEHGRVHGTTIVFSKPLPLAEGTEVAVLIEPVVEESRASQGAEQIDFGALPFFGMWADRTEMADSAGWVSKERERWQQRMSRQD
jgi:hypothetical protein